MADPTDARHSARATPDAWLRPALRPVLLALAAGYALQLFSPLRLPGDAIEYLSLAASIADGKFAYHKFPPAYPALIYGLERIGLGCSAGIIGLNCVLMGIALVAAGFLLRRQLKLPRRWAGGICCLTMLSFVMIKHVTLPLSEMAFFATSMTCLVALAGVQRTIGFRRWCLLVSALALATVSVMLRVIAIALIPLLLWNIGLVCREAFVRIARRRPWVMVALIGASAVGLAAGGILLVRTEYVEHLVLGRVGRLFSFYVTAAARGYEGGAQTLVSVVRYRLTEWGELAANVPRAKLPVPLAALLPVLGVVAFASAGFGASVRRCVTHVDVYLLLYTLILTVWPFFDTRFWLPVLPLLMGYIALAWRRLPSRRGLRLGLALYVAVFSLFGVIALGYSTWISLSGSRLGEVYGDGSLRATYRAAFGVTPVAAAEINVEALRVLRRYECRARAPQSHSGDR